MPPFHWGARAMKRAKKSNKSSETSAEDEARRAELRANMELALETPDCILEIFGKLKCSLSLRRAQATCHAWREQLDRSNPVCAALWKAAWLTVPVRNEKTGKILLTAEHALRRAPAGERIMLAAGTALVCGAAAYLLYLLLREPSRHSAEPTRTPQEALALARKALSDHAALTAAEIAAG